MSPTNFDVYPISTLFFKSHSPQRKGPLPYPTPSSTLQLLLHRGPGASGAAWNTPAFLMPMPIPHV